MSRTHQAPAAEDSQYLPRSGPGLLLGIGLGGFVDGIVLHQILQWHHMVSNTDRPVTTLEGLRVNTFADGLFHLATWLFVTVGVLLTIAGWRQGRLPPTWRSQVGLLAAGWGIFNVLEGLINHQILGVHHVRDDLGGPLSWDLAFLAWGLALLAGGWALHLADRDRSGHQQAVPTVPGSELPPARTAPLRRPGA